MENITKFVEDVLTLILREDPFEQQLLKQLPLLQVTEHEYTGIGVYIYFTAERVADSDRIPVTPYILDGVQIVSDELELGASIFVFITDGVIDCLEIWGHGDEYPSHDLLNYTLQVTWQM